MTKKKQEPVGYGYCPDCGAPGATRERRINGNDRCQNGHQYPSAKAVAEPPGGSVKAKPKPKPKLKGKKKR